MMNKGAAHKPRGHPTPPTARRDNTEFTGKCEPAQHFLTYFTLWSGVRSGNVVGNGSEEMVDEGLIVPEPHQALLRRIGTIPRQTFDALAIADVKYYSILLKALGKPSRRYDYIKCHNYSNMPRSCPG